MREITELLFSWAGTAVCASGDCFVIFSNRDRRLLAAFQFAD